MSPMLALYAWPAISLVILRWLRLPLAILVVLLAGYMFLPTRFAIDFPLVPPLDKHVLPVLSVAAVVVLLGARYVDVPQLPGYAPRSRLAQLMIVAMVLGAVGIALTNDDPIVTPLEVLQGLGLHEGFSMALNTALMILPLLVGRKYFATPDRHHLILVAFCVAGAIYALFAVYEARMSPQLNTQFYGFRAHSWVQHVRGDGFRPMVFQEHGLRLSLFFAMALIAAVGLFRLGWKPAVALPLVLWLALTLVLCKSLGALMIGFAAVPFVLFLSIRGMIMAAALIGMVVLTYPMLRGGGYVPLDPIVSFARSINPTRAESLEYRMGHEEMLLERANERPVFGWGGFARSFVRNEKGIDISVPDGYWVILIGWGGWVAYLTQFGLMTAPMLFLFFYRRKMQVTRETAVLSIMLAANMVDLIPNSGLTPLTWLISGALWGRLEIANQTQLSEAVPEPQGRLRAPTYARDFGPIRERNTARVHQHP